MDIDQAVDRAIDEVFSHDRYVLNLYQVATKLKLKHQVMREFLTGSVAQEVRELIYQLDEYIKGGRDSEHEQLREAYGNIPKPRARKIRSYMYKILEDAIRYERERKASSKTSRSRDK